MLTSVREIHLSSESDSSYFLRVDWEGRSLGSGFQLLLTDGQDAWRGEVSEAAVNSEAEELEMQREKYIQDLQQALTATENNSSYSFTLTPDPPNRNCSVTLTYEKIQKDISFRLGCVRLEAVTEPVEVVREVLIHSLERGNTLHTTNHKLREENQRLRQEHQRIAAELKRYTEGKEALEAELYSRFVLVLNEKKAKIRSLQETVTNMQETRSSGGQKSKESVKSTKTADQDGEAEQDEYGGSTDEEPEEVQQSTSTSNVPSQESSTPSPLGDGLRDITDVAPCRKRRFRHLGAPEATVKRPTPETSQRKRTDCPAGSSQLQTPQRSADAAAATSAAEDLFEDF
ncbi:DNA repair protein XRCC4 [Kryptolebias marmoratus]|uniref:X-ray repair complementing defective repair in Chinese hamster cells 4 n=1 Tax=Kryptolebias marmoratus TaxID=37003 RepID=A0A3Q3A677_KRYMA|nr:DNA repair protein XRCC4 [Kryptolebias marmoratus]